MQKFLKISINLMIKGEIMKVERKISVEDFQRLHIAVGWKILSDAQIEIALKNTMFVSTAREGEEVVAMARVVGDFAVHGILCDVIVHPEMQKKGYGRVVMEDLLSQIQAFVDERDEFILELTPTPGNIEFYKKFGLKHSPENMDGMYKWFKNSHLYPENCKKHSMKLQDSPFQAIKNGYKTIEMRLNDEKRQKLKIGDYIIFLNVKDGERLWCKIKNIYKFDSFASLYKAFDKVKLGYKKDEIARPSDMGKYYAKAEQEKYGVIGIELEVVKDI